MKSISKAIVMALISMFAVCACSSTNVYREHDGSLLITESGNQLKFSGGDTFIKGAVLGEVTPASKLSTARRAHVKPKLREIQTEGFIDWTDPGRVEIRMITIARDRAYQLSINGKHRVLSRSGSSSQMASDKKKPAEHTSIDTEEDAIAVVLEEIQSKGEDSKRVECSAKRVDGNWRVTAWRIWYPENEGSSRFVPGGFSTYVVNTEGKILKTMPGH